MPLAWREKSTATSSSASAAALALLLAIGVPAISGAQTTTTPSSGTSAAGTIAWSSRSLRSTTVMSGESNATFSPG